MSKIGVELLRVVHRSPGLTRAQAVRALGKGSGPTTEAVAALVGGKWLAEGDPVSDGRRGRPTRPLLPHPAGPLVLAVHVGHRTWRLRVVELGGAVLSETVGNHDGTQDVLAEVRAGTRKALRRYGDRVLGAGLAAPGVVRAGFELDAPLLGWRNADLRRVWPAQVARRVVKHANDARCAALAESVRGRAIGAGLHLHLQLDLHDEAGLGGALVQRGALVEGRNAGAGEFGHLPFGDPGVRCKCGATGCWGTQFLLDDPDQVSRTLGRGTSGLVNSLDPDLVTIGGHAAEVVASTSFLDTFSRGLMDVRRADPPPVLIAALDADGPVVGAAELVWAELLA